MSNSRYDFGRVEKAMQSLWKEGGLFDLNTHGAKGKKYILDMFPYPSGAGLHVGHLLGYFGSAVMAVHARMQGHQVLHPMGFDAFGLPAEQYAIDTGQHPAITITHNIASYKKLLKATGICFSWDREIATTDADYYRWTQWIFLQLFHSWYNKEQDRAEPISTLIAHFQQKGSQGIQAACQMRRTLFTAKEWKAMSPKVQQDILGEYRLAYLAKTAVNWCAKLGTVLANDEVKDGLSERGGYPVIRKTMWQWSLRMTAYADRLLEGLQELDWTDSIKEMQRNWIGKSLGAEITFDTLEGEVKAIEVFTTRIDTLFGVTFIALAPEHPLVADIIAWQEAQGGDFLTLLADMVEKYGANIATQHLHKTAEGGLRHYVAQAKNRSECTRMKEVEHASGLFTGLYVKHPLTGNAIPVWVADYVLPGYGTGAVMAVPAHDQRDYLFAKWMDISIIPVIEGGDIDSAAYESKEGKLINSGNFTGCSVGEAQEKLYTELQRLGVARPTVHYRLHDPVFSRQRYWGEPFPIYYKEGQPQPFIEGSLPLILPEIDVYAPDATGAPPLSRAKGWHTREGYSIEQHTMPAWAGSSWYFLRYMDPHNDKALVGREAVDYWQAVDLYMGGKEHATGHLLYARFFTKFLYDRGVIPLQEPFLKLVNQGMIQSFSRFVYRCKGTNTFVSHGLKEQYDTTPLRVNIHLVKGDVLDLKGFKKWRPDFADASFILEEGSYICGRALEKMSKSKHNTIDPFPIIEKYGADALRMYLLFLGPIQQSQPWSMKGIEGIVRFMRKIWRLFVHYQERPTMATPVAEERRIVHQAIKQVAYGIERFAFNTSISALMVCVNELNTIQCTKKEIIELFVRMLAPFAPHMAEYLWQSLGHSTTIMGVAFPDYDENYLQENTFVYPITIDGKLRAQLETTLDHGQQKLSAMALALPKIQRWLHNSTIKKIIVVPKHIINIVTARPPV